MAGECLSTVDQHPYLGAQLDHYLSWRGILAIVSIHCCIRLGGLPYNFVGNVTD